MADSAHCQPLRIEAKRRVGAAWVSMVGGIVVAAGNVGGSAILLLGGVALAAFSIASVAWHWRHPFLEADAERIVIYDRPVPPAKTVALNAIESWKYLVRNGDVSRTRHTVHGRVTNVRLSDGAGARFSRSGELLGLLERFTPR